MTASFSISRLLKLIRKQWFENARLYIFSTLALLALLGMFFLFWITTSGRYFSEEGTYIIFLIGAYLAAAIFASQSFNMLSDKAKGGYWLSFPASHLEKLLCIVFYNVIFFTVVYCACFFLIKSAAMASVHSMVAEKPGLYSFKAMNWDLGFGPYFSNFIYAYFALQSFYLLGSIYFTRYSFVITTVVGAALLFAYALYTIYLSKSMLPDGYYWNGVSAAHYVQDGDQFLKNAVELSPFTKGLLINSIKLIWAPLFYVVAWFRLKEKEI